MNIFATIKTNISKLQTRDTMESRGSFDSFFKKAKQSYIPELATVIVLVILAGVYVTSFASVGTRQPIVFQGRLTDTSYVPSPDGNYPMKFKIFDAASGGTCLWATGSNNNDNTGGAANCPSGGDLASPVAVSRGVFTVRLGDTASGSDNNPAINLDFNSGQYYLEITVGPISGSATDTLSPRVRMGGSPYAYNADLFDGLDSTSFVRSDLVPTGSGVLQGASTINPASATANYTLLGVAVNNAEKFRVDAEGDVFLAGTTITDSGALTMSSTSGNLTLATATSGDLILNPVGKVGIFNTTPVTKLDIVGNTRITGRGTAVLTGSIDPTVSTSVTGVGTLFTTELVVGDRITVSGETRTVVAIASDTALTVDTAFSDNANDTSVDVLYAIATYRDATPTTQLVLNDQGRLGIGSVAPVSDLDIAGLAINTDADGTIGGEKVSTTFTKNDTNTRSFSVLKAIPTFNFGASNTNTVVNIFEIDSTNTNTTGLTANLIKASYGGSEKFRVDSSGNTFIQGNAELGAASTATGQLKLYNSSSANATTIQAGNASAAVTYTWPTAAPTSNGQVLSSTTGGVLSWATASGGGSGVNHQTTVDWFDDFIAAGNLISTSDTAGIGEKNWYYRGISGSITGTTEPDTLGVYELSGGASSGNFASIASGFDSFLGNLWGIPGNQSNYTITVRAKLSSTSVTSNTLARFGLVNSSSAPSAVVNGVYFETNGSGAWVGRTTASSTTSTTGTSVAVDNALHVFKIIMTGGTSVEFQICNSAGGFCTSLGTLTTNIPTISMGSTIAVWPAATTAVVEKLRIDYYGLSITGLTR